MNCCKAILPVGMILILQACAPTGPDKANLAIIEPGQVSAVSADYDSLAFQARLQQTQSKNAALGASRRKQAEDHLADWRDFELRAAMYRTRRDNPLFMETMPLDRQGFHVGLARSIAALEDAVEIDPAFAEAWAGLGHLRLEIGDIQGGLTVLKKAMMAAKAEADRGFPLEHDTLLEVYRDRGWALRDLARWDEGLAVVDEGLSFQHGDQDLLLIKGLLLAGAGQYEEATALASRLPAFPVRLYDKYQSGLEIQPSDYASRWIRSQALLAQGDTKGALWIFGRLENDDDGQLIGSGFLHGFLRKSSMRHHRRFWNDAGLIGELNDAQEYPRYYLEAYRVRDYARYYPASVHYMGPLVLGVPSERAPCYLSFGSGFFLGGSPFAYVAAQMDIMSLTLLDDRKQAAADKALQVLDQLERRRLRPDICLALRGRIHYRQGKLTSARKELEQARDSFQMRQQVDDRTSLLLGVLALDREDFMPALTYLRESARVDSTVGVTWRSMGVALASVGRQDEAMVAMNRALDLEPASLTGYFNRGLLFLQMKRFPEAMADLDYARRLDPENQEIVRLLQTCAVAMRQQGQTPPAMRDLADLSNLGDMVPAGVTTEIPPDLLLEHLWGELTGMLGFDAQRYPDPRTLRELGQGWEEQYRQNPNPNLRKVIALLWLDLGDPARTINLLQGSWGRDLEPDEEVMLLYADFLAGHEQRARELAVRILADEKQVGNPYIAVLAARAVQNHPGQLPTGAPESIMARWIDDNGQSAGHSLRRWHVILTGAFRSLRQNFQGS